MIIMKHKEIVVPELQKYNEHSSIIIKLYTNSAVKRAIKYLQETDGHIINVKTVQ